MSSPSSSSKQMLDALSEIEPLAFYSPTNVQARPNPPSGSQQDTPDNPFYAIDLNRSVVPTGPGPFQDMLPDNLFEGDLPKHKASESNILAASEVLVIESLAMMREEAMAEQTEVLQRKDVQTTQPIFDKMRDVERYPSSSSSDSESEEEPLKWKVERREGEISRKGKEKVVEEAPRRRPTTRSAAQKMMANALKASAHSTAAVRSARTFKVSNFKMPETNVVELSGEEVEKKTKKNRSEKKKGKATKKFENTKSKGRDLRERGNGHSVTTQIGDATGTHIDPPM
ncbi:hypothetical protein EJD97_015537 [Solanum chilense]|uniref:Uncharacterized protein n=1 Tax=Solanum chilense TaxID=4083 RepID=A0A6N2AES0_SOLCI|nr:hypothetical protein EJD97_015537 [Solanum chilense]